MFDAGLFEMVVIFTLGLLVLGPERLPKVARFVGRWVGQARRAVTRLNNEIERELALDEIRRFKEESEKQLRDSDKQLREGLKSVEQEAVGAPAQPAASAASPANDAPRSDGGDTRDAAEG